MKRNSRFWIRLSLLGIMVALIGFTLYQVLEDGTSKKPQIGDTAPNFELTTIEGKQVTLNQLRGKAVVLNFWGSWCEPCKTEMPALTQIYEQYADKGLVVIGINIAETDVAVAQFVKQYGLNFSIWMDRDRDVVELYKIGPIPSTYFIDPQGKITYVREGPLVIDELERFVYPILPRK